MRRCFSFLFACAGLMLFIQNSYGQFYPLPGNTDSNPAQNSNVYPLLVPSDSTGTPPVQVQPLPAAQQFHLPAQPTVQQIPARTFESGFVFDQPQPVFEHACESCGFSDVETFDAHGSCRACGAKGVRAKLNEIKHHVPSSTYLYHHLNSVQTPRFDTPSIGPYSTGGTPWRERRPPRHFGFGY